MSDHSAMLIEDIKELSDRNKFDIQTDLRFYSKNQLNALIKNLEFILAEANALKKSAPF